MRRVRYAAGKLALFVLVVVNACPFRNTFRYGLNHGKEFGFRICDKAAAAASFYISLGLGPSHGFERRSDDNIESGTNFPSQFNSKRRLHELFHTTSARRARQHRNFDHMLEFIVNQSGCDNVDHTFKGAHRPSSVMAEAQRS